eukprot:6601351-Pyramimonas_sp.AAC.2
MLSITYGQLCYSLAVSCCVVTTHSRATRGMLALHVSPRALVSAQPTQYWAHCLRLILVLDIIGRTPLHAAAYKGETLAGLALIRMGASTTVKDKHTRSTITAALGAGYREAAKAFEEEAARPRPLSAVSVMMSTRPPSRVQVKDDDEELDGTTAP